MEKERKKVLHVIGGGEIGGAEQHILSLLKTLPDSEFELYLACLIDGPFAKLCRDQGIAVYVIPMRQGFGLGALSALVGLGRKLGLDLIHTHGLRANLLGRIAAGRLGIPSVTTVHSSLKHDYLSQSKAFTAQMIDRLTRRLPAAFIAVSEALARELQSQGASPVQVIYNGSPELEIGQPEQLRREFRKQQGIPSERVVIGCTARLHPTKGHAYLIESLKSLSTSHPELHLLLIGDGPLRQEIEAQLAHSSIGYTLTGFLPDAYKALPAMDIFVLPSLSEGMGLVLLEAMQAGVPIVATTAGGIPELIRPGVDGLLVPPANPQALAQALQALIEQPELRYMLVQNGKKRRQEFTVQRMAEETALLYQKVLEQKSKRH